jgi:hypothetical protein
VVARAQRKMHSNLTKHIKCSERKNLGRQKSNNILTVRIRGRENNLLVVSGRIYLVEPDHFLELLTAWALLGGRTGGSGAMWENKIRGITRKKLSIRESSHEEKSLLINSLINKTQEKTMVTIYQCSGYRLVSFWTSRIRILNYLNGSESLHQPAKIVKLKTDINVTKISTVIGK